MVKLDATEIRALASIIIDRRLLAQQHGQTFGGDRDIYEIYGYERVLTSQMYRDRYERGGLAGRIVDVYPFSTWRGGVELWEDEDPKVNTPFEKMWDELAERLEIIETLRKVDLLAQQGEYAALLLGTADPSELDQPLPKGNPNQLIYLQAYSQENATIQIWEEKISDPRFGKPKLYHLTRKHVAGAIAKPVHWSRIIHIAENTLDNDVYGQPRLRRVWNLLDDLEKITGGGSEAFHKRADRGLQFDFHKDLPDIGPEQLEEIKRQVDDYEHGRSRYLRTRGITVNELGSDVANIESPANAVIAQIAGAIGIPQRILKGSEMGELASSQDRDNWDAQVTDRQTGYATRVCLRQLADRLIMFGYLPKPKQYAPHWPGSDNLTQTEKAEGAKIWAQTNRIAGMAIYTDAEIREHWHGMQPLSEKDKKAVRDAMLPATTGPGAANEENDGQEGKEDEQGLERAASKKDPTIIINTPPSPQYRPLREVKRVIYDEQGRISHIIKEPPTVEGAKAS